MVRRAVEDRAGELLGANGLGSFIERQVAYKAPGSQNGPNQLGVRQEHDQHPYVLGHQERHGHSVDLGCAHRKSNPNTLVMESTKEWNGLDSPKRLHCPADNRIRAQREMCSGAVVVVSVGMQRVPEMPFAKDHDMIEALLPDRADETFTISVLPRRLRGFYTVTNDVAWCAVPTHSFGKLPGDTLRWRVCCRRQVGNLAPVVAHHHKSVVQLERDCRNHERIHGGDAVCLIVKNCLPSPGGRSSPPVHILGNGCLSNIDTEFEHFTVDAR